MYRSGLDDTRLIPRGADKSRALLLRLQGNRALYAAALGYTYGLPRLRVDALGVLSARLEALAIVHGERTEGVDFNEIANALLND